MISSVTLRRFKRFENQHFDLSGHVILAGPNNCGKTTVLQAVASWALALRRWRELNQFQRHGGAYSKAPLARQAFSSVPVRTFDLLWIDRGYTGQVDIEVELDNGSRIQVELHKDSTEQIHVRPSGTVEPALLRDLDLDVVYVATAGGVSVEEPVYQPEYIATLLGRQRPSDVIRNLLLQASNGTRWAKLVAAVDRMFGVTLLAPRTVGGTIISEYQQRTAGPTFDILSAGSGFQQVLLLLASLFTREGSVVLVDEPDAHLHVFLQDTIFEELGLAAAETRSQLVIATHSEVIFNSAVPEQICVMIGDAPRRLATPGDVDRLRGAVGILQQSDLVEAVEAPGILYLEGHPDLELLRAWANVLEHPVAVHLNRRPFWRPVVFQPRRDAPGIRASDHYEAICLVRANLSGVWLVDSDGKSRVGLSAGPEPGRLNRLAWKRYESESYLLHPSALARFIDRHAGAGGIEAVRAGITAAFTQEMGSATAQLVDDFFANPFTPPGVVQRFLEQNKARTSLIGVILSAGGVHGFPYTRFAEIAALMRPDEVHPEVREKLDFVREAFEL